MTNLQGDVLAILDGSKQVVASYSYDPYGKPLTTTGSMASTLGADNPLRYRGYVYDSETGFYYLQSRYYDPAIGRFINADSYASTGQGIIGHNMFAYCLNRPVAATDRAGGRTYFINGISNDDEDAPPYADDFKKAMEEQNVDDVILIPIYTNQDNFFKTAIGAIEVVLEMFNIDVYTGIVVNAILADLKTNPLKEGEQINIVGYSGGGQVALNVMEALENKVDNVVLIGTPVMEVSKTQTKISMIYAGYDVLSWNLTIGIEQHFGGWYGHSGYFSEANLENTVRTIKKIFEKE